MLCLANLKFVNRGGVASLDSALPIYIYRLASALMMIYNMKLWSYMFRKCDITSLSFAHGLVLVNRM